MKHKQPALNARDKYQIGDFVLVDGKFHQWDISDYNRSINGMSHVADIPLIISFFAENGYEIRTGNTVIIDAEFDVELDMICEPDSICFCPQCGIFLNSVADFQHYLRLRDEPADNLKLVMSVKP